MTFEEGTRISCKRPDLVAHLDNFLTQKSSSKVILGKPPNSFQNVTKVPSNTTVLMIAHARKHNLVECNQKLYLSIRCTFYGVGANSNSSRTGSGHFEVSRMRPFFLQRIPRQYCGENIIITMIPTTTNIYNISNHSSFQPFSC